MCLRFVWRKRFPIVSTRIGGRTRLGLTSLENNSVAFVMFWRSVDHKDV